MTLNARPLFPSASMPPTLSKPYLPLPPSQRKLKQLVGGYTFLEAYERTGRILNVSVCPADTNEPARLLNYLTAPNVRRGVGLAPGHQQSAANRPTQPTNPTQSINSTTNQSNQPSKPKQALIWSAVAASSAFPGLFQPQDIVARNARGEEVPFNSVAGGGASAPAAAATAAAAGAANGERRWRDGSLELDLPTFLLAEMFNCNHFIVSQCNPHIVPLLNFKKTLSRRWANLFELELRHKCQQAQWLLSDVFPTKWLMLFTQPWEGDITIVLPR
jgi:TAG lipase/steryl ester hydrolase/phospholipase A2/LPA acyltransferase